MDGTDGIQLLGDISITVPGTYYGPDIEGLGIAGLDGMAAFTVQLRFAYGAGGTSVTPFLQSSLDQGTTWFDIWCEAFTTSSAVKIANLAANAAAASVVPGDGTLSPGTLSGYLGDRLRLKAIVLGTYTNTVLSARAAVR